MVARHPICSIYLLYIYIKRSASITPSHIKNLLIDGTQRMNLNILFFSVLVASSFFLPTLSDICHKNDRSALLSIKSGMGNPSSIITWGDPMQTSDCCEWVGVSCDMGRVYSLQILNDNVSGQISPSIGDLPYLVSLIFHNLTNLTGNIPSTITKLTGLTSLGLDMNSLSGPVPSFLSQLTKLDYLNLAYNQFSGSIPSSLGTLPLGIILLNRNRLTGPIPESLASIPNAAYLHLSHNNLSGTIPKAFSDTKWIRIHLSRNSLSGDASLFFGENKPLRNLDLSRNMFEFDLSKVKLPKGMYKLDLNRNKVYGGIPSAFTKHYWQTFNVSYNRLCGEIPTGGGFDGLDATAFFHNRCLCGAPLSPCESVITTTV